MASLKLILFIVIFLLYGFIWNHFVLAYKVCGPNTVHRCEQPGCYFTCQRRGLPPSCFNQNATCENGCYCKTGYLNDETKGNKCVPFRECTCPKPNQVFSEGNKCWDKCVKRVCPLNIMLGCFCKQGYCANTKGTCVPRNST